MSDSKLNVPANATVSSCTHEVRFTQSPHWASVVLSDYGFRWWPKGSTTTIMVDRVATFNGRAVLRVSTEHDDVEVVVSKAGRSIRVWRTRTGKELKEANDE